MSWAGLPGGLTPGKLNDWINNEASYLNGEVTPLERKYRMQLVGVTDSYLREIVSNSSGVSSLTYPDRRMSNELFSDLISLFIDKTVMFILEPPGYPKIWNDIKNFEEFGQEFASSISRQLRASIRVSIGTLLRGFWTFSIQNTAIIELVSTSLATLFSSIAEGVIRSLTWNVKIQSKYDSDTTVFPNKFLTIPSLACSTKSVEYVAYLRNKPEGYMKNDLKGRLKDLIFDYVSYIDMCFHEFENEDRFGNKSPIEDWELKASFDRNTNQLKIILEYDDDLTKPFPVIRAYVLGEVYLMNLKNNNTYYFNTKKLNYTPYKECEVHCLSNYGVLLKAEVKILN